MLARLASAYAAPELVMDVGLQERQGGQLVSRGCGQRLVLLGGQRRDHVPGLAGDDDAGPAGGDDLAELLQDEGHADEVDSDDGLRRGLGR